MASPIAMPGDGHAPALRTHINLTLYRQVIGPA